METADRRLSLPLIFTSQGFGAIQPLSRGCQIQERNLANLHSVVESYGQPRQVAQFQGQVPFPPRVHKPGRRVNDQPASSQRTLSFKPGYQVLGEFDVLSGTTQNKIARMQNQRLVLANLDQIAESFQAFLYINIVLQSH